MKHGAPNPGWQIKREACKALEIPYPMYLPVSRVRSCAKLNELPVTLDPTFAIHWTLFSCTHHPSIPELHYSHESAD